MYKIFITLVLCLISLSLCLAPRVVEAELVINQAMTGSTATGWVLGGSPNTAYLTGNGTVDTVGDGWLRLTSAETTQTGFAYYSTAFDIENGAVIQFEYATWGGTGADGYSVFLFDAETSDTEFDIGASGGSLGYAPKSGINGLVGGYIGIGVDEFGNYSQANEGRTGGIGFTEDAVAIRGPEESSYIYIDGTDTLSEGLWSSETTRPDQTDDGYRKVQIQLTAAAAPDYLLANVWVQFGYTSSLTKVLSDVSIGYEPPDQVKIGYAASTGSVTNYHEIRNLLVSETAITTDYEITAEVNDSLVSSTAETIWTVTVRNNGPSETTAVVPIEISLPDNFTAISWVCAADDESSCTTASGTGTAAISTSAVLAAESSVVYTISASYDGAEDENLVFEAEITPPIDDFDSSNDALALTLSASSSLVSSTISVSDLNGGDVEPGDVLKYMIQLTESAGFDVSQLQVLADLPTETAFLTLLSFPSDATNQSVDTLNITDISIDGSNTVTISYTVVVSGEDGETISETAQIYDADSNLLLTLEAEDLTIVEAVSDCSEMTILYFGDLESGTSQSLQLTSSTSTSSVDLIDGDVTWSFESLYGSASFDGTATLEFLVTAFASQTLTLEAELQTNGTLIASDSTSISRARGSTYFVTFTFDIDDLELSAEDSLDLVLSASSSSSSAYAQVQPYYSSSYISNLELPTCQSLTVENVEYYTAAYDEMSAYTQLSPSEDVYIRAEVIAAFGEEQIGESTLVLTQPDGTEVVSDGTMTSVYTDAQSQIVEYSVTLPSETNVGWWIAQVTAQHASLELSASAYALKEMTSLMLPMLTLLKTSSVATALPGESVTYTLLITNTGAGSATEVSVIDTLPNFVSWPISSIPIDGLQLTYDDSTLLIDPALSFSNDHGATYQYSPSSGTEAAVGYDGQVTNWKLTFSGSLAAAEQVKIIYSLKLDE
jgi:uncharacterized repeat protein (TIGR01451 family)